MIVSKTSKINGFACKNRSLKNTELNFSCALVLINFRCEGGVQDLGTPDLLDRVRNSLEVLEDSASVLDLLD